MKKWRWTALGAAGAIILIIGALAIWNFYSRGPSSEPAVSDVEEAPKTIAVLPFEDISPEKDQEYFVDGLSEELINCLTQISDLHVTSRQSSFTFKGSDKTIQEIANILGREYILEGSVRKADNALRITTQLIHAADDRHLWSKTYDRELKDIFAIQEDIATAVADELKITLRIGQSLKQLGGTNNIEAYEQYLSAKWLRSSDEEKTRQALELIDSAIDLDPEFALAWAEKARNHIMLSVIGPYSHSIEEADVALRAAQKAVELEPNLGDGYIYLGYIKLAKREWIEAEINFRKALELIGESLSGDDDYIIIFYETVGKFKRTQELLEEMRRNDPIHQAIGSWYYTLYGHLGDRHKADEEYQRRNKLLLKGYSDWHDESITRVRLCSGDVLSRDEIASSNPIHIKLKEYLDSPEEGLMELRQIYRSDDNLSMWNRTIISIWAGYFDDPEFEMEVIEEGANINSTYTAYLWFPIMREFRQTPRYKEFVMRIGLVDYWKEYGWPDLCRPVGDDDFVCD